ncbi:MAG: DUF6526 family protein [Gemmatimonadales bacterium]
MAKEQTYSTHRRYFPAHHFFVIPVLAINAVVEATRLFREQTGSNLWSLLVALALLTFGFTARVMALKVQDRVIRLEERVRLAGLVPEEERARVNELAARHLVALRFASDEEAPDLTRRVLTGEYKTPGEVKKNIKNWKPDNFRA